MTRGMSTATSEVANNKRRRLVLLEDQFPTVLWNGRANKRITMVAVADDRGCRKHVEMPAVAPSNLMIGGDLMIHFDIELPSRVAANNHLAPVGVRKCGVRYVW